MRKLLAVPILVFGLMGPLLAEVVTLEHNGLTLNANLERAGGAEWTSGPVVLMVHGTLAHRGMEIMTTLQTLLAERDVSSLAINLSLGLDDRAPAMYDCATPHVHKHTDAVGEIGAWLGWLADQGAQQVALLGHSRGGNQVARVASARAAPDLVAVLLVGPMTWDADRDAQGYRQRFGTDLFPQLDRARQQVAAGKGTELMIDIDLLYCENTRASAEAFLSYHAPDENMDTPLLLAQISAPVTVFAGSEDTVVADLVEKVRPQADGTKVSLVVLEGADHYFRDLYAEDLADTVAANLATD